MDAVMRAYRGEGDYWRIRDFLRKALRLNGRLELSWQVHRCDYWAVQNVANMVPKGPTVTLTGFTR